MTNKVSMPQSRATVVARLHDLTPTRKPAEALTYLVWASEETIRATNTDYSIVWRPHSSEKAIPAEGGHNTSKYFRPAVTIV